MTKKRFAGVLDILRTTLRDMPGDVDHVTTAVVQRIQELINFDPTGSARSMMTKKRFAGIQTILQDALKHADSIYQDRIPDIMDQISVLIKFDPNASRYTPELGQKIKAWRRKKAEALGVSTYEAFQSSGRAYYEKNIEACQQRMREAWWKRKAEKAAQEAKASEESQEVR
jgi:hypothetical protein